MKICFIDTLFNWPPRGGADVDVFNILSILHKKNYDVLLLSLSSTKLTRGVFIPETLPFPTKKLNVNFKTSSLKTIKDYFIHSVSDFNPDILIIGDSFFLKPIITLFFKDASIPIIWRQYAYELLCHKDIVKYRNNKPCPLDYLSTTDVCRQCFLHHQKESLKSYQFNAWLEEYILTKAYKTNYLNILTSSLSRVKQVIVYSDTMQNCWKCYHPNTRIIPGGVDTQMFHPSQNTNIYSHDIKKILFPGRVEDEVKGFHVLYEACKQLRNKRIDFELICTSGWSTGYPDWVKFIGWYSHYELPSIYTTADICVIPSLWEEPFGLVALEAMASSKPIIASNIGGLKSVILHGETGLLYPPTDKNILMTHLDSLLSNETLRSNLGTAGRNHVIKNYTWEKIVEDYYEPLIFNKPK
ncbi:MAG TPA: glycosyltransferase family 4 protein [Candidatus Hydrogenedens sp.]|nr:glycosyltransferase family 4 protein [Candidatus Hydrogenedens sp.]HOK08039.1 glycosyltransferase family 4 protein [Candidatus Hydrogenedens sp.]HOL20799.1 glycosyltransferase family 4 protein [Candidatus Hydrogenedens sp.]HPP57968.1 glycosyltransferase family 4 protein [Candidatus Hydrogenedens sp.]